MNITNRAIRFDPLDSTPNLNPSPNVYPNNVNPNNIAPHTIPNPNNNIPMPNQSVASQQPYKVISLFSGCGGLDLGLIGGFDFLGKTYHKNPFQIVLANDINPKAVQTQKHNCQDIPNIICGDVHLLLQQTLPQVDLLVGGFPCQDFSLAGKQKGLNSERGNLYKAMIAILQKTKPKIFLAENVKGLLLWQHGLAIQTILNDFENCGYNVQYKLLNTADYGVPQLRERVIIVGVRKDIQKEFLFPKPTHTQNPTVYNDIPTKSQTNALKKWVTIQQAISDLEDETIAKNHFNNDYSKAKRNKGQGNTTTKADFPAPTMRAEHHGNIEFHYKLPRRLSAREAARIQSFPDNFEFLQSTTDAYRQIGNAVAPVFAWHLAQSIIQILSRQNN